MPTEIKDGSPCGCGGTFREPQNQPGVLICDGKCRSRFLCCDCGEWMSRGSGHFKTDYKCTKCGNEFAGPGQKLAPRRCWGEETGEQFY